MRLTTERLLLREFVQSDWQALYAIETDPEVQRYRTGQSDMAPEQTRAWIRSRQTLAEAQPRLNYTFAIVEQRAATLIGCCCLNIRSLDLREGEIWYMLDRCFWGQGYMTEATWQLLSLGFQQLGLHRIWAQCVRENSQSVRVLEKLGMRREGHLREAYWQKEAWWDLLLYAILDREWSIARGRFGASVL